MLSQNTFASQLAPTGQPPMMAGPVGMPMQGGPRPVVQGTMQSGGLQPTMPGQLPMAGGAPVVRPMPIAGPGGVAPGQGRPMPVQNNIRRMVM
jgi:hypothetical protein